MPKHLWPLKECAIRLMGERGIAQRLHLHFSTSNPQFDSLHSQEFFVLDVADIYWRSCLEWSGHSLGNVDRTHLVLKSCTANKEIMLWWDTKELSLTWSLGSRRNTCWMSSAAVGSTMATTPTTLTTAATVTDNNRNDADTDADVDEEDLILATIIFRSVRKLYRVER